VSQSRSRPQLYGSSLRSISLTSIGVSCASFNNQLPVQPIDLFLVTSQTQRSLQVSPAATACSCNFEADSSMLSFSFSLPFSGLYFKSNARHHSARCNAFLGILGRPIAWAFGDLYRSFSTDSPVTVRPEKRLRQSERKAHACIVMTTVTCPLFTCRAFDFFCTDTNPP
jgi:hypothetical protein